MPIVFLENMKLMILNLMLVNMVNIIITKRFKSSLYCSGSQTFSTSNPFTGTKKILNQIKINNISMSYLAVSTSKLKGCKYSQFIEK